MRLIGDIHGDLYSYMSLISGVEESVQVGDFGIGFIQDEPVDDLHKDGRHKFIRGNHDNPGLCKERVGYIEDGTYDERGILYIGGAWSIDYSRRIPGLNWWHDEELSNPELARMRELMFKYKPKIVVTHDCPSSVAADLFLSGNNKRQYKTRTGEALEGMFMEHQPETWVFGHWHEDADRVINGTRFICLGINSHIDLGV